MATAFPGGLDTFTNPTATDQVSVVDHAAQHSDKNDAVEAIEAKVGIDGSAVTSSHDYKLSGVTGADTAASLAGTETLTNKTIAGASNTLTVLAATQLSGAVPIANGGTGQTAQTPAFDALAPTTTKGDLIVHDGTDNIREAVGADGQFLSANSAQASGLEWVTSVGSTEEWKFPGDGHVSGATVGTDDSGRYAAITHTDGVDNEIWYVNFTVPSAANGLGVSSIQVMYKNKSGVASNIFGNFETFHFDFSAGGAITTDITGTNTTFASETTVDVVGLITAPADAIDGLPGTVNEGDIIGVSFNRLGAQASDTYGNDLYVLGMRVLYA